LGSKCRKKKRKQHTFGYAVRLKENNLRREMPLTDSFNVMLGNITVVNKVICIGYYYDKIRFTR